MLPPTWKVLPKILGVSGSLRRLHSPTEIFKWILCNDHQLLCGSLSIHSKYRFASTVRPFADFGNDIQFEGTTFAQALWRPYEKELGDFESTLLKQNDEVEAEIRLASEQAADKERKAAAQYRRNEIISRDKATKHARERRLLKDQHSASKQCSTMVICVYIIIVQIGVERKKLLDKLSSHDYWSAMRRIRKKRHGQTSSWLSRSKAFTDWLEDANSSTLWLSGIRKIILSASSFSQTLITYVVGSGKSTVTSVTSGRFSKSHSKLISVALPS